MDTFSPNSYWQRRRLQTMFGVVLSFYRKKTPTKLHQIPSINLIQHVYVYIIIALNLRVTHVILRACISRTSVLRQRHRCLFCVIIMCWLDRYELCWAITHSFQPQKGPRCIQKSSVSRLKRAHWSNKQRTPLRHCAASLSSANPFHVLTTQELLTITGCQVHEHANISGFSGRLWCTTTSFHCPTLPWQHCNPDSA